MSEKEVFDADEALNQEIMRMSTDDLVTGLGCSTMR